MLSQKSALILYNFYHVAAIALGKGTCLFLLIAFKAYFSKFQ